MFQGLKKQIKRCPFLYKALREPYRFIRKVVYAPYELYLDAVALYNMYRVRERIRKQKKDKLTVIFLMQFPESWDKVRTVYECMKKDERFDAKIFCVPMEKEHKEFHLFSYDTNPTYDWFVKKGYVDAINALVGKDEWYNLKELKPDYVFYTRPYNILLPKQYRSSEVSKYALLNIIMYGITLYIEMAVAVVQRSFFRYVYCFFPDFEEGKDFFCGLNVVNRFLHFQKCEFLGCPVLENVFDKAGECSDIWDFAKNNRKVLWTPRWSTDERIGGSNFFKYRDFIMEYAKIHKEVAFLIRPHPLMFINFEQTGQMTSDERDVFFKNCKDLGNVEIDTTDNYISTFWNSDILLTDFSSIIPEYFVTGKPIIYCEWENGYHMTTFMKKMFDSMYIVHNSKEIEVELEKLLVDNDVLRNVRYSNIHGIAKGCSYEIVEKVYGSVVL